MVQPTLKLPLGNNRHSGGNCSQQQSPGNSLHNKYHDNQVPKRRFLNDNQTSTRSIGIQPQKQQRGRFSSAGSSTSHRVVDASLPTSATVVHQQQRNSRLGDRWGPREDEQLVTPELLPSDEARRDKERQGLNVAAASDARMPIAKGEQQQISVSVIGVSCRKPVTDGRNDAISTMVQNSEHCRDYSVSVIAEPGGPKGNKGAAEPKDVIGLVVDANILKKNAESQSDSSVTTYTALALPLGSKKADDPKCRSSYGCNDSIAEPAIPSPKIPTFGFTATERRAVETTELTEASTVSLATMDTSTASSKPLRTALPTAVVVQRQVETVLGSIGTTLISQLSDAASVPISLDVRIPKKKSSRGFELLSSRAGLHKTYAGRIPNREASPAKKDVEVPEVVDDNSSDAFVYPSGSKTCAKRRLRKVSDESSDQPALAEDNCAVGNKCDKAKRKKLKASRNNLDPSLVTIGARVAVFWDGEGKYFTGTVTKEAPGTKKPFFIEYDDGDKEWMTFHGERFRLLSVPAMRNIDAANADTKADEKHKYISEDKSLSKEKSTKNTNNETGNATELGPTKNIPVVASNRHLSENNLEQTEVKCAMLAKLTSVNVTGLQHGAKSSLQQNKECKSSITPVGLESKLPPKYADESEKRKFKKRMAPKKSKIDSLQEKAAIISTVSDVVDRNHELGLTDAVRYVASADNRGEIEDWVSAGIQGKDSSDSETDEEELMRWASTMFGISRPIARRKATASDEVTQNCIKIPNPSWDNSWYAADVPMSISEKVKLAKRCRSGSVSYSLTPPKLKDDPHEAKAKIEADNEEDAKRKKEQARPLTAAEISAIIGEDFPSLEATSWVRRSVRQPSKSVLNAPRVKALIEKLRSNDSDMVVLKMKKYCSDLDTPTLVIAAVLDALEENTNCEALYIQVRSMPKLR